jgi:Zn-dependent protease
VNDPRGDYTSEPDHRTVPGDATGPPNEPVLADESAEPEGDAYDAVLYEWEQLQNPQASWFKAVRTLVITGLVFFFLGMFRHPAADIILLMVVILVHESGHFLGMRLFGYSNVRMFFIPMFGAGVSGRKTGVEGYKEAIVVLLGPLPGLVIGFFLALASGMTGEKWLGSAAMWFVILNAFNLLPVFPLDGGRLLQITLFSRNRYLETLFQVVAIMFLFALAFFGGVWPFYILAGLMMIGLPVSFKVNGLALELSRQLTELQLSPSNDIPRPLFRYLVDRVRERFPAATRPRDTARFVLQVWERMHASQPGILATLALLFIYGSFLVGTPVAFAVLALAFGWLEPPPG